MMSAITILSEWKKNSYKPLYWLEGEEEFYIDEVMEYAEKKILTGKDAEFNLSIFYGKDANWADVINACRRYPMFAERQVVLAHQAEHGVAAFLCTVGIAPRAVIAGAFEHGRERSGFRHCQRFEVFAE